MTNSGEISVNTSINALGFLGSVGRPGLRLENQAHAAKGWQPAIATGRGQLDGIVDARKYFREYIGLKAAAVEQIVLEELAGLVGFGKGLKRQIGVWPIRQLHQPCL